MTLFSKDELEREPIVAKVREAGCVACFSCKKVCPYGAVEEKEIRDRQGNLIKVVAWVNPGVCGGCGTCQATCPSKSVELDGYTDEQIIAHDRSTVKSITPRRHGEHERVKDKKILV